MQSAFSDTPGIVWFWMCLKNTRKACLSWVCLLFWQALKKKKNHWSPAYLGIFACSCRFPLLLFKGAGRLSCWIGLLTFKIMSNKLKGIYKSFKYISQIFGNASVSSLSPLFYTNFPPNFSLGSGWFGTDLINWDYFSGERARDGDWVSDRCEACGTYWVGWPFWYSTQLGTLSPSSGLNIFTSL